VANAAEAHSLAAYADLLADELNVKTVRASARSGLAVASEGGCLCALATDLIPALVNEGLTREFVRRVQELRKRANLDVADRIRLSYRATPRLAEAVLAFRDYILTETLSLAMTDEVDEAAAHFMSNSFDGEQMTAAIVKAG